MLSSINDVTLSTEPVVTSVYSLHSNMEPKIEKKLAYSLPYLQNRIYNIWWSTGIDFKHVAMRTSPYYKDT